MNSIKREIFPALTALLALSAITDASGQTYSNFEGKQTNPIRVSADGTRLFAVNTADARLSVFDLTDPASPRRIAEIPVGLEPVSVNPRSNDEVWVVNEVSDSVSIVSVSRGIVTATLRVKDEPMDVVFAGGRAFASAGGRNELAIFDANTREALTKIPLRGLNPRALAVSPDGSKVYVAFALSGNRTTIIPKEKAPNQPAPTNITNAPPKVALIVDAEDPAWASEIQYTMPDNDAAEIDANSLTVTRYFTRLGTVNLGLGVNPQNGDLWVANTDARNLTSFEPNVRGYTHFNRVTRVDITTGGATPFDLNPDVNYGVMPNLDARAKALAQPASIVFDPSGDYFFVAAFGTDRVAKVDTAGEVLDRIEVGGVAGATADPRNKRGPRGLALHPTGSHLYVLNRIANTISVINTRTSSVMAEFPTGAYDPTPAVIRAGRGFLYDARLSGNGTMSCASCHVDAEMDQLAWNLGDLGGQLQTVLVASGPFTTTTVPAHPMKGPMTTQTLRGLQGQEPLHWRGDRASFLDFNPAFGSLLGGDLLTSADMQAFKSFIETIAFPPNPHRNLDATLPAQVGPGDPRAGETYFRNTRFLIPAVGASVRCIDCHSHATGVEARSSFRVGGPSPALDIVQPAKIPQLRSTYQKIYFDNSTGAESLAGFGFEHDGVKAGIAQAHTGPRFESIQNNETIINNLTAFLLCFDTGTWPAVGYDLTATQENVSSTAVSNQWNTLEQQAQLARIDLIAKAEFGGLFYDRVSRTYRSDIQADLARTRAWIESQIAGGATVTLMGVPFGAGVRMGIDRNLDGILDGLERTKPMLSLPRANSDPTTFQFLLYGPSGLTVLLQRSTDLQNWQDWQTRTIAENPASISDSEAGVNLQFFYRARVQGVSP
ncbi:MAG TPA: YncE family protein [Methylomirabilota bacterium]|nr:YncE family protein [Methylomirabilota bacterium]